MSVFLSLNDKINRSFVCLFEYIGAAALWPRASYPHTPQSDQGEGLNQDHSTRVVLAMTPLPFWPRCQQLAFKLL